MNRPNENEYTSYYGYYINLVPEGDIIELMRSSHQETQTILQQIAPSMGNFRYAPGKWTIKELIQHMIDTERIMNYRALRFARKDKTELSGFEQDDYVSVLEETERFPLSVFVEDWEILRENTLRLFKRFNDEESMRTGRASNSIFSVRALAYINVGHEIHHRNVLVERYLK
jgi:hypothetical protein